MVRAGLVSLIVIGWLAGDALGAPAARQRVVLTDLDPELRHAMEQALAPWQLEVVIDGGSPEDAGAARQRADADTARFVVWRDAADLVVYDRELGTTERRASRSGTLDPVTAAAAALTIKTMMRLPPPPPPPPDEASTPVSPGAAPELALRIQVGIATRIARGDTTETSARFGGAVALRPWASSSWRFGLAGAAGTSASVSRASFKGSWSEWAVLGVVSWSYARGAWELEPHADAGFRRSTLDGTEVAAARSEAATLATAGGGMWVRLRHARWTLGAALGFDRTFGAPTYSKTGTPAEIFQVPGTAVELGGVAAMDL